MVCVPAPLLLGPAELSTFLTCLSACSAAASAGVADSAAAHTAVAFASAVSIPSKAMKFSSIVSGWTCVCLLQLDLCLGCTDPRQESH